MASSTLAYLEDARRRGVSGYGYVNPTDCRCEYCAQILAGMRLVDPERNWSVP